MKVVQSCPTLRYFMDCSLQGSSVHGIFQVRILEWVSISSSRGSSLLQGILPTQRLNPGILHCRWILYCLSLQESQVTKLIHIDGEKHFNYIIVYILCYFIQSLCFHDAAVQFNAFSKLLSYSLDVIISFLENNS